MAKYRSAGGEKQSQSARALDADEESADKPKPIYSFRIPRAAYCVRSPKDCEKELEKTKPISGS